MSLFSKVIEKIRKATHKVSEGISKHELNDEYPYNAPSFESKSTKPIYTIWNPNTAHIEAMLKHRRPQIPQPVFVGDNMAYLRTENADNNKIDNYLMYGSLLTGIGVLLGVMLMRKD